MAQKIILPVLLAALFTVIFSVHSLSRHNTFNSHALDLGIHTQASFLFAKNLLPFSSILHMPYLADHFGLIMLILSPIYKLFPSAATILVLQALLVSLSSIFIYAIALDKLRNVLLSSLITLSYLAAPGVLSAINFDFHLATISVFPLSLMLYAWYFKKFKLYWTSLILGITFKEDIQIFIFGLGIYQLIQKQHKQGAITLLLAASSFYLIKFQIMPSLWFGVENLDIGTSLLPLTDPFTLIYLFLLRPNIFMDQIFNSPVKLNTIDFVYRQFAFLPLLSPLSWFTVFPALFLRFSSLATHFWTSSFHYNANLTPFLAVSAILALKKFRIPFFPVIILLIFFLITGGLTPNGMIWRTMQNPFQDPSRFRHIEDDLQTIPASAAVSAQSPLVPHIANREKIYMFPEIYDAEYIVLDPSLSNYPLRPEELQSKIAALEKSKYWQIYKETKSLIIFQKRP